MTDADLQAAATPPASLADRLIFALRQAALLGVALLIAGLVTERLRPTAVLDRGLASTPFFWAIVAWLVVLTFNAIAFERSQMNLLERTPLLAGLAVAAVVFVIGLVSLDGESFLRRMIYVLANSLGALMFWWALFSVVALLWQRIVGDR